MYVQYRTYRICRSVDKASTLGACLNRGLSLLTNLDESRCSRPSHCLYFVVVFHCCGSMGVSRDQGGNGCDPAGIYLFFSGSYGVKAEADRNGLLLLTALFSQSSSLPVAGDEAEGARVLLAASRLPPSHKKQGLSYASLTRASST